MKKKLLFTLVIILIAVSIVLMLQYMWFYIEHHRNKMEFVVLAVGALLATPMLLAIRKYTD